MKKPTQEDRVVKQLLKTGFITRNQCLQNYISRLSAIIQNLEEKGWEFETKNNKGDYVYTVIKSPYKKVVRTLSNGQQIINYEKTNTY